MDLNRQLDRLNARLQTLTQEMTEQGDSHSANEKKLKQDCNAKLDQQIGKVTALSSDLTDCRSDQVDMRNRLEECKEEVRSGKEEWLALSEGVSHPVCVSAAGFEDSSHLNFKSGIK